MVNFFTKKKKNKNQNSPSIGHKKKLGNSTEKCKGRIKK